MKLGTFFSIVGSLLFATSNAASYAPAEFKHPGLLQTSADFDRIRTNVIAEKQPWLGAWRALEKSRFASPTYQPRPAATIYRGPDGVHAQNYPQLYNDVAAAYALAVRYSISHNTAYADAAVRIMDAWSSTLEALGGSTDIYLAAGIYGYQFCQAGEILRNYSGWPKTDFVRFQSMMTGVFYPIVEGWFDSHEGWRSYATSVYANWDLSQIACAMAVGVLTDNQTIYNRGVQWFYNGTGNGQINQAIPFTHWYDNQLLGQTQEAGRDQGHNMLDIAHLGVIAQMAYNQDIDLYGYNGSLILAAAEYTARYNMFYDVPYTAYNHWPLVLPGISNSSRGQQRPIWEILYNHYGVLKRQNTTWTKRFRDMVVSAHNGAEGGSGDYGTNSGGFDQLGWGTLLYTL